MLTNVLVLAGLLVLPAAALHRLAVDWRWTGAYTLAIHALAYAAYVLEKKRAQEGQRRLPEARLHEGDLVTDRAGQDRNPGVAGHGLSGERPHKHDIAERFAAQVCEELETARNQGQFRKLYVVAAPAFLGMLRHHQSPALRQLIVAEIDKGLATQDPAAIRKALPDFL